LGLDAYASDDPAQTNLLPANQQTIYVYRFLDVADDDHNNNQIDFIKTYDALPNTENQIETVGLNVPASAMPAIDVSNKTDYSYSLDSSTGTVSISFHPSSTQARPGELVLTLPDNKTDNIKLYGVGLGQQYVNFSLSNFTSAIQQVIALKPPVNNSVSSFVNLFSNPTTDPQGFATDVSNMYNAVKSIISSEYKMADPAADSALNIADGAFSGIKINVQIQGTANGKLSSATAQWADFKRSVFNTLVTQADHISPAQLQYDFSNLVNTYYSDGVNLFLDILAAQIQPLGGQPDFQSIAEIRIANALTHEIGHDLGSIHLRGLFDNQIGILENQPYIAGSIMGLGAVSNAVNSFGPKLSPIVQYALGLPVSQAGFNSVYAYYKEMVNLETYGFDGAPSPGDDDTDLGIGAGYLGVYSSAPQLSSPVPNVVSSLDFGTTLTGSAPITQTIYLFNDGDQNLNISNIHLLQGSVGFSVVGLTPLPLVLPPINPTSQQLGPSTYALMLQFNPTVPGQAEDTLEIDSDTIGGAPVQIPLQGQGIVPTAAVSVTLNGADNLGGARLNAPATVGQFATVSDSGSQPLTITGISSDSPEFVVTGLPAGFGVSAPMTLAPGQAITFGVTFQPNVTGLARGNIDIITNDPNTPTYRLRVDGTGLPASGSIAHLDNDYVAIEEPDLPGAPVIHLISDSMGNFQAFLPANTYVHFAIFDPVSGLIANGYTTTAASGQTTTLPTAVFQASTAPDTNGDGLPDDIKFAIGASLTKSDTNGDGIDDFTSIQEGLNPLANVSFPTGVIASLPLQGQAQAVALTGSISSQAGQTAYIATGSYGLAIVNASQFNKPVVQGQTALPGNSTAIAVDTTDNLAIVASGPVGVNIVNVADPTNPVLTQTVKLPSGAQGVVFFDGLAYVASGPSLVSIDPLTGEVQQTLALGGGQITGLAREGSFVYTMDGSNNLRVVDVSGFVMVARGSVTLPDGGGNLFITNGIAYAVATHNVAGGYETANVSNPDAPALIAASQVAPPNSLPASAIVPNGSGLGVLVGTPQRSTTGPVLDLMNLSDPTKTASFVTQISLPLSPLDVTIASGIAYVADGSGGLQVVNYESFDTKGQPPTATVTVSPSVDQDPSTPGIQVLEGSTIPIQAQVSDDVQVRNVELLVDGQVVQNVVSLPLGHLKGKTHSV
jgi:hypothetical protein